MDRYTNIDLSKYDVTVVITSHAIHKMKFQDLIDHVNFVHDIAQIKSKFGIGKPAFLEDVLKEAVAQDR